jgi:hypothetical protein
MDPRQRPRVEWAGPSTISRELHRKATAANVYRPFAAQRRATTRRARHHRRRVHANLELRQLLGELLSQRWSPSQISRHLRQRFPDDPTMWLCHGSIYQSAYQPGSPLMRPSRWLRSIVPPLRTGRDHRRAQQRSDRRRPRFEQPMLSIHQRPFPPDDRAEAGHWEGDLIIGKDQQSAIGTLVERQTRLVRLLHLPQRDGDTLHDTLNARLGELPLACGGQSHGTRAPRWHATSRSPRHSAHRSTSATRAHHGNAARTKTPTGSCATTSPKAPIYASTPSRTCSLLKRAQQPPNAESGDRAPVDIFAPSKGQVTLPVFHHGLRIGGLTKPAEVSSSVGA